MTLVNVRTLGHTHTNQVWIYYKDEWHTLQVRTAYQHNPNTQDQIELSDIDKTFMFSKQAVSNVISYWLWECPIKSNYHWVWGPRNPVINF